MEFISRFLQDPVSPDSFEYFEPEDVSGFAGETLTPTEKATEWNDDWNFNPYANYVPTTVDPDWSFTIYIIVGCLCVNLSLPLWIYLGKRWGFHETAEQRRRLKEKEWEGAYHASGNTANNNNKSFSAGDDPLINQLDEARSVISGYSFAPGGSVAPDGDHPAPPGSVVSGSIALSRAGTHLGFSHNPHNLRDNGDTASVFSTTSGFTDALLGARPRRIPQGRRRARQSKRMIVSKSLVMGDGEEEASARTRDGTKKKLDVRMAAEFTKAEIDLIQQRNEAAQQEPNTTPTTSSSVVDFGFLDDSRSDAAPSILSKLDADAISVRDAVDARDGGNLPLEVDGKIAHYSSKNSKANSYFSRAWKRLMAIADWDKEMKKYLALAGHYSAQGILVEILGVVEIAAIGNVMGVRQASAYMVVEIITGFTGTITTGFYESTGVLIPQANGARNNLMVGRYMQIAVFFYTITALPGAILWCFCTERAVLWYKFDEETAKMAQIYFYSTLPGYATYGVDAVLYELLNTVGYESYCTTFTVISSSIHTGIVLGMLYGGVKDLYVLGFIETASDIICLVVNFVYISRKGWLDPYWEGMFKTNGLKDRRAVMNVVNTAIPLSFAWVLTYGEWEIMTFFCRYMSDNGAEVAAWGLMGYLWSAFETLTGTLQQSIEYVFGTFVFVHTNTGALFRCLL